MPVIPVNPPPLNCQGTYIFTDVMNVVKDLTHQIPTTVSQVYVCDKIASIVHLYWPWNWALFKISPILAIDGMQDYPLTLPANFYKLTAGRIIRTDVSPFQYQPIKIAGHLEAEVQRQGSINTIQSISFEANINAIRLDIPLQVQGTTAYFIDLDYQSTPTKVMTLAAVICPPDRYFNVFVEGVLWGIYRLADDPRTGAVTINRAGDKTYTGQLGVFMTALEEMRRMEDSGQSLDNRWPEEPLGWVRTGNPGLFPTI